jgi:hypothetical protein
MYKKSKQKKSNSRKIKKTLNITFFCFDHIIFSSAVLLYIQKHEGEKGDFEL